MREFSMTALETVREVIRELGEVCLDLDHPPYSAERLAGILDRCSEELAEAATGLLVDAP
jgi:hypothetical protein